MFANKYHLGNLINIVDCNGQQIGGTTAAIMPLGELASKYLHFGWTVQTVNGHNLFALIKALKIAKASTIYPACIIAKTVMGQGISFMENDYHYHDVKNCRQTYIFRPKWNRNQRLLNPCVKAFLRLSWIGCHWPQSLCCQCRSSPLGYARSFFCPF